MNKLKSAFFYTLGAAIILTGSLYALTHFTGEGSYFNYKTKQLNNDKVGRLDAQGEDLRIYEFTPQSNPKKQCVFVAGAQKAGLQCWDKQ